MTEKTTRLYEAPVREYSTSNITSLFLLPFHLVVMVLLCKNGPGGIFPFATAYCASVSQKYTPVAVIGGFIGWVLFDMGEFSLKYIVSFLIICAFEMFVGMANIHVNRERTSPFVAALALGFPSVMIMVSVSPTLYNITLTICEIVLSAGSAYFFFKAHRIRLTPNIVISKSEIVAVLMSICLVLPGLYSIEISGISLGAIFICTAVLCVSFTLGSGSGAVLGTIFAFSPVISGTGDMFLLSALPLSVIICGVFAPLGKLFVSLSFIVAYAFSTAFIGDTDIIASLVISAISALIFIIMPTKFLQSILAPAAFIGSENIRAVCEIVKARIVGFTQSVDYVRETGSNISYELDKLKAVNENGIYRYVAENTCANCSENTLCWQKYYSDTIDVFSKAVKVLKENQVLSSTDFPTHFRERCVNMYEIGNAVTMGYGEYLRGLRMAREVARVRNNAWEQLDSVSNMMETLADNICTLSYTDPVIQKKMHRYFTDVGGSPISCLYYIDTNNRSVARVCIPTYKLPRVDIHESALKLSALCEIDFNLPTLSTSGEYTTLVFRQAGKYKVKFSFLQYSAYEEEYCGDCVRQFTAEGGNAYTILSDGMGSGTGAALQSNMTVDMLSKLIENGCDTESAVQMVNASLMAKSHKECLSTVDIASIDLYTGSVNFYKAGAAPSYIIKDGRVSIVSLNSLPIGIIKAQDGQRFTTTLSAEDTVVLVSDGAGETWVQNELQSMTTISPEQIANRLCEEAIKRRNGTKEDDITVAVMRLTM